MTDDMLARYRTHRYGKVRLIVVHVNEGPDTPGGAVGVARYNQLPKEQRGNSVGGYHVICDDVQTIVTAADDDVVNGAAGANMDGYHVCIVGSAEQTAEQWNDPYSRLAGTRAAEAVRSACARLAVPMKQIGPSAIRAGASGICGHVDISDAYHQSTHTDPGKFFPWPQFMQTVLGPSGPPTGDDMPLNESDKAEIQRIVTDVLRKEGVSGAVSSSYSSVDNAVIAELGPKLDQIIALLNK